MKAWSSLKCLNKGKLTKYPTLEVALVKWIKEKKNNQQAVSWNMIQVKAKALI